MKSRYQFITIYERTVHTMFFTLLILGLVYVAILLSLVFSVIERKQNGLAIKDMTSQLSSIEMSYANKIVSIDENTLQINNYTRIDGTTFAVRKDDIASYTVLYGR